MNERSGEGNALGGVRGGSGGGDTGGVGSGMGTSGGMAEVAGLLRRQAWESRVLEGISEGKALHEVLMCLARGVEEMIPPALASILLVDEDGARLRPGVAPTLLEMHPAELDGVPIGPRAGSCGTAAYRREAVIAMDIATDPLWENAREWALSNGLRACWSMPVIGATGAVLATFALYYRESRVPRPEELELIRRTAHLVGIAVERDRKEAELRASEERFRRVFDDAAVGLAITTLEGRFIETNPAYRTMLGRDEEALRATDITALTHPGDREHFWAWWTELIGGYRERLVTEKRAVRVGGGAVWIRVSVAPQRDSKGRPVRMVVVAEDITQQRTAEAEAARLGRRLTATLERISDALFTLDAQWRFTYLNAEAERLMERARAQVLGVSIWEAFPEVVGTRFETEYRRAVAEGVTVAVEAHYPTLEKWFDVKAYPSPDGLAVYFREVTEQRRNREALRAQAELLDKAQDAIVVRDLEHRVLYWNKSAERLYGWPVEEILGRSVEELLFQDPEAYRAVVAATRRDGEWIGELEQRTREGESLTVEGRWTLVRDDEGKPKCILAINTDVTQRKRLEAQFLRAQRLESIGTLAGGIAHDLNNVLAPIMMSIDLLKLLVTDPECREILSTIGRSAERGAAMVRQVLTFARGMESQRVEVRPAQVIHDVIRIVRDTFPKSIRTLDRLASDLWSVQAEPTQLHQVLINLCVNARDAMPEGGQILISAENVMVDERDAAMSLDLRPGPHVRIEVEDTGSGIPGEILDKIFDPFFTTKEVGKGTGLGLSTSLSIIRSHGGVLRAFGGAGKGARFRIDLPALGASSDAQAGAGLTPSPRGSGEWVLVADDEAAIRQITRQTLEAFGYRVLLASDGAEAVEIFRRRREKIAVVLMDMMMPTMDGTTAIRSLLEIEPEARVVAVSGVSGPGPTAFGSGNGVRRFLRKPYTAPALLAAVHEAMTGA
ncbi:MAG: PAS domain S-box protein [Verrucomicrobiae bacterium]|nr:PAS domain S-box protein [Verrucomicrobiae bacterium]